LPPEWNAINVNTACSKIRIFQEEIRLRVTGNVTAVIQTILALGLNASSAGTNLIGKNSSIATIKGRVIRTGNVTSAGYQIFHIDKNVLNADTA
jgi:hypothetical protein